MFLRCTKFVKFWEVHATEDVDVEGAASLNIDTTDSRSNNMRKRGK